MIQSVITRFCKNIYIADWKNFFPNLLHVEDIWAIFHLQRKSKVLGPLVGAQFLSWVGEWGKGRGVEFCRDGICAYKSLITGLGSQEGSSQHIFHSASSVFLRLERVSRAWWVLKTVLRHCFFGWVLKWVWQLIPIGFVSLKLCLPPSQLLKNNHFSVRLGIAESEFI